MIFLPDTLVMARSKYKKALLSQQAGDGLMVFGISKLKVELGAWNEGSMDAP